MDIKREPRKTLLKRWWLLGIAGIGLIVFIVTQFNLMSGAAKVPGHQLLYASVQQGDLDIYVEGYGQLQSSRQKMLAASSDATVEEIVLKPGAIVSAGSVILIMSNPELIQSAENARQALIQEQANFRKLELDQARDLLEEHNDIAELEASLKVELIKLEAEQVLFNKGIVSKLQFKQTQVKAQQYEEQLIIQHDRLKQLTLVHQEALNIQKEIIKQAENQHQIEVDRIAALTIRAKMSGVLQTLSVSLGQSVNAGQELARVGSTDELEAHIKVPHNRADKIEIGQSAVIDTRSGKIFGEVHRIDPTVTQGTVLVEVALHKPLAANALPGLNVDGVINLGKLENTLYIERPLNVQEHAKATLYKLVDDTQIARVTTVEFGGQVGPFIRILNGAAVGEQFVLTDLSMYKQRDIIIQ